MAACANCRISSQLLEHAQIPQLRCVVQIREPLAGAPGGATIPSPVTADALHQAGWRPDLVLQMPRELYQPTLAELPISLRQPQELLPPARSPILNDCDTYVGLKHYFLAGYSVAGPEHLQHLTSSGRLALVHAGP